MSASGPTSSTTAVSDTGDGHDIKAAWRLFALVGGSTLVTSINFSLVFIALGPIGKTFHASPSLTSWALTLYSITNASLLVPAGWMADRFGRKRMFLLGLALFAVGSAMIALSPWIGFVFAGRIMQAMGTVAESSAAVPILLDAFPVKMRATVMGTLGATGGVAASIGPVLGGALVDNIGWRATFFINAPLGLMLCGLVYVKLAESGGRSVNAPPDLAGVAALMLGMASLVLSITQVSKWGVLDVRTVAAFCLAIALLSVVVLRSRVHPDPVLYLPLFRDASFRRGTILNVLIAGTFSGTFFAFIRLLTDAWKLSVFHAGLAVAVVPMIGGPLSFVAGRIADRRGPRLVIVVGGAIIALSGIILAIAVSERSNVAGVFLPIAALYGVGVGFAHAACHAAALRTVSAERLGVGAAMSRIGMDLGGIVTVAIAVALVSSAPDPVSGIRTFMVVISAVCGIGALYALGLSNAPKPLSDPAAVPAR